MQDSLTNSRFQEVRFQRSTGWMGLGKKISVRQGWGKKKARDRRKRNMDRKLIDLHTVLFFCFLLLIFKIVWGIHSPSRIRSPLTSLTSGRCCTAGWHWEFAPWIGAHKCVRAYKVVSIVFATLWTVARQAPVHGILQARILEWVAVPSSRGSSQTWDGTSSPGSPALAGGFFITSATWKVPGAHKAELLNPR